MKELIGNVPKESDFIGKFRQHQGWYRVCVMNEPEGTYWDGKNKKTCKVCNRINNGEASEKNFLSDEIKETVRIALNPNEKRQAGIIEPDRMYNNLLSSQPLAFNFFGYFNAHKEIALPFLQTLRPDITSVEDVVFEYAPKSTKDHSAFDFGFIVTSAAGKGFIGFECKYTDTFSYKRSKKKENPDDKDFYYGEEGDKNYEDYHKLYMNNRHRLIDEYYSYVRNKYYNQLFRNELLAVQLKPEFDFVITGLFCHHEDNKAVKAGLEFQKKIGNGINDFILLTYADYFERLQKLNLTWKQRELVMMFWARYCGLKLSEEIR